ncbi:hypothetical protein AMS68_002123 [Peltaster fructicola]|uniref:Uncharacterized protein n=1 Tax=Peltaster fructicola TaxID=286661 RepID=A0A6H0XPJ3_9PEZI|nr:hypothetical protein AMS68_002123 [Peltaster fructicola]
MSGSSPWSDRRGMFQPGKQVHEPGRKLSGGGVFEAVRRASTSSSTDEPKSAVEAPATSGRRRSSAAPFENLTTLKRGSQDYSERRASHSEQGPSSMVSGWFNKTFRGMTGSATAAAAGAPEQSQKEPRRGVMEERLKNWHILS